MSDTSNTTSPISSSSPPSSVSNFLAETPAPQKSEDTLYNDFFQENSNGEITIGAKKERSGLELLVTVLEYTAILFVIIGVLGAIHVFIRTMNNTEFFKSYTFICPYLQYDINIPDEDKWCNSISTTINTYTEKNKILEENIITALTDYIPIKVSSSILDASPEKNFIISAYNTKPHVNEVLEAFENIKTKVQKSSPDPTLDSNIKCNGISVTQWNILSTQCVVYGGAIWSSNTNGEIGSARIEAINFMEKLGNTAESSLLLSAFPTTLTIETIWEKDSLNPGFKTRTTLPIQVTYVPLIEKF